MGCTHTQCSCRDNTTAQHVRSEAEAMSEAVVVHWERLKTILDRHAGTIYKRWAKKTKTQRVAVLLEAWPQMSATHRPDYAAFRKGIQNHHEISTKVRDAYMWPHINLEDLSKVKTLPLFMEARTHNDPYVFARADLDATGLARDARAVVPLILHGYVIMFSSPQSSGLYGELVTWEGDHNCLPWSNNGFGLQPGYGLMVLEIQQRIYGLMVLEIQQRIYQFLVTCCESVMHDIVAEQLATNLYVVQSRPTLAQETVYGFESRAIMAAEAPYRAPAALDLARLVTLFATRLAAAEDHIWALKEDPGYFAEAMFHIKEHSCQLIKDGDGSEEKVSWSYVTEVVIQWAYMTLEMWHELHNQVQNLHSLQAKHQASISVGAQLPEEYLQPLLVFLRYLDVASKIPLGQLKIVAYAAPLVRCYFMRVPNATLYPDWQVSLKPNLALGNVEEEVLGLLMVLCGDGRNMASTGFEDAIDQLDRLLQTEPVARNMISARVAECFEDVAIIAEALRQFRLFQPWATVFEQQDVVRAQAIIRDLLPYVVLGQQLSKGTARIHDAILRSGDPDPKRLFYPIGKRRTKENTEAMRSAEARLDSLWLAVETPVKKYTGSRFGETAIGILLAQQKALLRTPEWKEPDHGKRGAAGSVEALAVPLSELYFDLEHRTEATIGRAEPPKDTKKTKTRGRGSHTGEGGIGPLSYVDTRDVQPVFQVDARALRVFRTLFYTPSLDATPGEVAWTDVLHAMVATGFVPVKLYGSIWQFQPTKLDVERSIQFHEPHPSPKLSYHEARRVGRRLARAYGWAGGMFELAKKAT